LLQVRGQAVYGSIYGTVTDKSSAVIPNATITVTDVSKGTSTTALANESGEYRVQHLIPDTYRVAAEAKGFTTETVDNVVVYADTAPEVNLQLTVGVVSQNVTVTGGATLLQTDRPDVTTILNERAVEDLPNLNRNFTAFELLTPGTTYIGWGPGEGGGNPQRSQSIEVDGQLPFATGYELDGTDNQEPLNGVAVINPNLDAVSEMKVTAQNYDAEFGKAVAGLVTAQTRSGSNAFHGTAFEYRRSDAQQARDPFANAPPNDTLAPTLHNQFGGSVGGPILHDKLFFFADYQGLREKTGVSTLTTVPTLKAETTCTSGGPCDLSDYLSVGQIYKPNSLTDSSNAGRTAYAGNIIPASDLSSAAVAFFKLLPPRTHPQRQSKIIMRRPVPASSQPISPMYVSTPSSATSFIYLDVIRTLVAISPEIRSLGRLAVSALVPAALREPMPSITRAWLRAATMSFHRAGLPIFDSATTGFTTTRRVRMATSRWGTSLASQMPTWATFH
jgi:Carboxypeptidase regulatory-like domain